MGQCTNRAYGYDADSNRQSLSTYNPLPNGTCQSTTVSATESYNYDSADRLVSTAQSGATSNYSYDTEGDITSTPSADAGGSGDVTATYFADGLLNTQSQAGSTDTYALDPQQNRFLSIQSGGGSTTTNHYADSSDNPAWASAGGSSWTRYATGLDGSLAAISTSAGTTTLELVDLHGDILATVNPASDAAPLATYSYTEFGATESLSATPGQYGYLGGDQVSGQAFGGDLLTGVRAYSTSLGRFDETDSVVGGSANAYDYSNQNPVTQSDVS